MDGQGGLSCMKQHALRVTFGCNAQAPWLLLIETDYIWMKPLQAPAAHAPSSRGMAYPFNYIVPQAPALESVMRKMYPAELGPLDGIPGSGPAPVMMRFDEWLQVRACFLGLTKIGGCDHWWHQCNLYCTSSLLLI